jgi:iron complex transport system permease protein
LGAYVVEKLGDSIALRKATFAQVMFILIGITIILFFFSLGIGRYSISLDTTVRCLLMQGNVDPTVKTVIFQIRVPRVLAALLVGAVLSSSGSAFQGVFKNPLVSAQLLGVSAGAGFGAAMAIIMNWGISAIQLCAFVFGVIAVVATYSLSRVYKSSSTLGLVLSGIIIGSFFSALVSLIQYQADPRGTLSGIVFWLMGSLATIKGSTLLQVAPVMLAGLVGLLLIRWRINILAMGEEEAQSLGTDLRKTRGLVILFSTLATAAAVSVSGVIGWIGLVIPHISRMIVGPDYKKLLPVTMLLGAIYLLIIDNIARTMTEGEIPIGILTALIGTPFFAYVLWKTKVGGA